MKLTKGTLILLFILITKLISAQGINGVRHYWEPALTIGAGSLIYHYDKRDESKIWQWAALKPSFTYSYLLSKRLSLGIVTDISSGPFKSYGEIKNSGADPKVVNFKGNLNNFGIGIDFKTFRAKKGSIAPFGPYMSWRLIKRYGNIIIKNVSTTDNTVEESVNLNIGKWDYTNLVIGLGRNDGIGKYYTLGFEVYFDMRVSSGQLNLKEHETYDFKKMERNIGWLDLTESNLNFFGIKITLGINRGFRNITTNP